jgi:hypothetical protein
LSWDALRPIEQLTGLSALEVTLAAEGEEGDLVVGHAAAGMSGVAQPHA